MSKVLISFLGTAQPKDRQYRTAKYHFHDGREIESSFVASALREYYDIDRLILVGTVKSMWEEVYRTFVDKDNVDENYYIQLSDHCLSADHNSELLLPNVDLLESAIGCGSKVVLIHYGLTESEIKENSEIILGIEQYLSKNDEIYVDITHSFRSLPMFLMNTLIYLQNVSNKHISVKHITYGMLDVSEEMGYTPIVELNDIMAMNAWITGAYSFKEYGNAYTVAELINDQSVSSKLTKFSDLMNLNHLSGIEKQQQELAGLKNKEYDSQLPKMLIEPIVGEFIDKFKNRTHSEFQIKLARWQMEHKNYASAYISLIEGIVTYLCESNDLSWNGYDERERMKDVLKGKLSGYVVDSELIQIYKDSNRLRNSVAHSIATAENYKAMIITLKNSISALEKILKIKK